MSIRVYESTAIDFSNNGLKALHPLFAEITKVKDGDYYIEIEDLLDNFEYYQKGMILRVNTPKTWGGKDYQCFRCDNPRVENNRIYCKAWHLFYDSKNYIIAEHFTRYEKTCDEVIKEYKNNVDGAGNCPFSNSKIATMSSNITIKADTEIEDMSLYDVIEYLREVYSGSLVRDNFNIAINQSIGENRGVVLAYGKNITDMKAEEIWDDVCTKILPYTMVGDEKITLNVQAYDFEPFVALEDIGESNPYDIPYAKVVEFKNESGSEDYSTVRDWLYAEAVKYLRANKFPKVNYKVSAEMGNVSDVGDTIHIKHPKIITNDYLISTVMSVKYDAIRGKYTEIEFGNFRRAIKTFFTETTAIKGEISKTAEAIKSVSSVADLLTNNNVIYRGSDILIVDTLPAEETLKCYRIGDTGISCSSDGGTTFSRVMGIDGTIEANGSGDAGGLILYNAGKCLQIGNLFSSPNNFLRIRQKDGDTWKSWRYLQEEGAVLYDNTATTGSTSVNLNTYINSNDDFKYIEIFYSLFTAGYDGNKNDFYHSVKVYSPL